MHQQGKVLFRSSKKPYGLATNSSRLASLVLLGLLASAGPPGCGNESGGSTPASSGRNGTGGTTTTTTGGTTTATTGGTTTTTTGGTTTTTTGGTTTTTGGTTTTTGGTTGIAGGGGGNATGGAGGTTATGGTAGQGGKGGTTGSGGSAGVGGLTATGGTIGTGGTSSGTGGKACNTTGDWTPKSGDLWISPSGNDSNAGTEASPKKNLTAAISAWSAGKTIWVMPGTYAYSARVTLATSGTSAAMLRISGITGEAKPVFDFSGETRAIDNDGDRGFVFTASYVHLRYLEIKKAADNGIYLTGSNNVLEWLSIHESQDTGLQVSAGAANNKILNVDSYLNADPTGENADGFAPKLTIGPNNYFCGTRSYQNADDGYDCWDAGNNSPVTFEYCWAFGMPGPTATASSDGNGFKLGSPSTADRPTEGNAAHKLISCFSFNNKSSGFSSNGNSSGQITCTNCGVWGNGTAWSTGTGGVLPQHTGDITNLTVTVDKAMNAPRDANGNLPDITRL